MNTEIYGGTAIIAALWYFQRGKASEAAPEKGPVTFVCVRSGESCRLAHLHFSEYE